MNKWLQWKCNFTHVSENGMMGEKENSTNPGWKLLRCFCWWLQDEKEWMGRFCCLICLRARLCHTIQVLAYFLFYWSFSNCFSHPTIPRQLSISITHLACFLARLLLREDCSICLFVPLRGNNFAWKCLVSLNVGFFVCRFSSESMRFNLNQKHHCSCCCFFPELFNHF